MKVCLAIPPVHDLYPYQAVRKGLEHIGGHILPPTEIFGAELLVVWSPWHGSRRAALEAHYRREGKPIIVLENGWLSPIGGRSYFQVARDGWNGTGTFPAAGAERWHRWQIGEAMWITEDRGFVLVCGQRGHPYDDRTSKPGWHETVDLRALQQPGMRPGAPILRRARDSMRPLGADLVGAAQVHVWSSNAASWAVLRGIPVVQHGPNLMVSSLASRPGQPLYRGERLPEFQRLAWAQWSSEEIETGEPFARLLVRA